MKKNIEQLTEWTPPKEIQTKFGPRILRSGPATDTFWEAYRADKEALRAAGITCKKDDRSGRWEAQWWAKLDASTVQAREEAKEASRKADANFEPPSQEGKTYLPFQRAGIAYALKVLSRGRGCLIGDEMGLGKTIQAIGTINSIEEIRKVLIVCPNTLKVNWRNELSRWLTRPLKVAVQTAGSPYVGGLADVVVINYDIVKKFQEQLSETPWDLRVIDECHFLKNPKAIRTKAVLAIPAKRKLSLTGTPILNRPIELFTVINDLDPETWPNLFRYAKRYCDAKQGWGRSWDFSGSSNLEELQDRLRETVMVRRLKSQVLTELPPKRRAVIELPQNGAAGLVQEEREAFDRAAQAAEMDELRARVELAKASEDPEEYAEAVRALKAGQGAVFAEMARVRHDVGLAKLPKVIEFCKDAIESTKIIIFAHHIDVVNGLVEAFPQAAVVTGETKAELRQDAVDRFQTDAGCNVFIGNLAAAEGLTLTASQHVVFAEGQWVPGKLMQMEDRAHRIGQHDSVLVSYLVLEGSLDAEMARACVDKMDVIDRALDRAHDAIQYDEVPAPKPSKGPAPVSARREALVKLAGKLSPEDIGAIHAGLQRLSGMDMDFAQTQNGIGFSKVDVRIGHELAEQPDLSKMQAALGFQLVAKYRRQIGDVWSQVEHLARKEGE